MTKFEELGLSANMLSTISKLKFEQPTQIQELSIPHIMAGEDVIGESATGSGKTLAFGCGIVEKVSPGKGLQALILTPTRELAEQIRGVLTQLAYSKRLNVLSVYGGVAIGPQIHGLSRAEVVVATPGRLLDHVQRNTINMSKINLLVLDEADRMFDMGFIEDIKKIIGKCPVKRQTICFSATISSEVGNLAHRYMNKPVMVSAAKMVDPSKLKQAFYDVPRHLKMSLLIHLLQSEKYGLVMVFCNTRKTVDFAVKNLRANNIDALAIHGGLSQNQRTRTITSFGGRASVLVCTDVASRGLHIDDVSHVYNYEIPKDAKDYVHRIGRTARAGEEGKVINLLCNLDYDNFSRIQREYRNFIIEQKELPVLKEVVFVKPEASRRESFGRRPFGRGQPERGQFRGEYSGGGSGRREQKRTPSFSGKRWR